MPSITKTMNREQIESLYNRMKSFIIRESEPQYTYWQIKTESGLTITAYKSGKVVYQGKDLSFLEDDSSADSSSGNTKSASDASPDLASCYPMAGSDEVGTGDFFGPVVVAAAVVPDEKTARRLAEMKITDSKAMTDEAIRKAAPILEELLPHTILVTENRKYNEIHKKTGNIKVIVSILHNQAYLNLIKKGVSLPDQVIIDQFCPPAAYFRYLQNAGEVFDRIHFETKAESRYLAVAAASVMARARFLDAMDAMKEKYGMTFNKGSGKPADQSGKAFLKKYPPEKLNEVAKVHFANMDKIGAGEYKEKK